MRYNWGIGNYIWLRNRYASQKPYRINSVEMLGWVLNCFNHYIMKGQDPHTLLNWRWTIYNKLKVVLRTNVAKAWAKLEMVIKNFPSYFVCSKTLVWNYLLWHLFGFWCKPALSTRGGSSGLKMQYFFPFFTIKLKFCYLNISKNIQLFKNLFVS